MIYKLDEATKEKMVKLPESGIGYQIVSARKNNEKQIKKFVVFNAEILIAQDDKLKVYSNTLIGNGYEILTNVLSIAKLDDIQILSDGKILGNTIINNQVDNSKRINTTTSDIYIRPSIYENDNRINLQSKVLLPGSFVTTVESYTNCHIMREDPVEMFTLPIQQDYIKVVYVKQYNNNIQIKGAFNNDFNRAGGGDKICFKTNGELLVKTKEKSERIKMQSNI